MFQALKTKLHIVRASSSEMDRARQQQQKPASSKPSVGAAARPKQAYSVVPTFRRRSRLVVERLEPEEVAIQPLQQLDDPQQWPCLLDSLISDEDSTAVQHVFEDESHQHPRRPASAHALDRAAKTQTANLFRMPAIKGTPAISQAHNRPGSSEADTRFSTGQRVSPQNQQTPYSQHARSPRAADRPRHMVHRHPPIAPEDPQELLQPHWTFQVSGVALFNPCWEVLQVMDPPRRRVVIFKGGGYVYADMEAMIQSAGLGHVMRLTNLMRKAHCVIAKERRDTGKRVNLSEHIAGARNANIPFLLIERLEPEQLVGLLRPLLIRKRIVIESPQAVRSAAAVSSSDSPTGVVYEAVEGSEVPDS